MLQLIKYRFLSILRDRTTMFWTLFFPLILCTLFYAAFGHIEESIDRIDTAVVMQNQSEEAKTFQEFLKSVEKSDENLIQVKEMSEKDAKSQLRQGKITGVFYADKESCLTVTGSDVEESILQALLEGYNSQVSFLTTIAKEKPEKLQEAMETLATDSSTGYVREASLGGKKTNGMIQYFFALIAMTCMFGYFLGFDVVIQLQANIKAVGARRTVSPTSKLKVMLSEVGLICVINFIDVVVLMLYMSKILKIEIGNEWGKMLLVGLLGSMIGVSLGLLIGSIGKWKESMKIAIMLLVSLGSSFLSGLMIGGIKGIIEQYCPIVNRINPASLITDAFYSIVIYNDPTRYMRNIVTMLVLIVVFFVGAFSMIRRVRYDSI